MSEQSLVLDDNISGLRVLVEGGQSDAPQLATIRADDKPLIETKPKVKVLPPQ